VEVTLGEAVIGVGGGGCLGGVGPRADHGVVSWTQSGVATSCNNVTSSQSFSACLRSRFGFRSRFLLRRAVLLESAVC
jgi:hypothetical protein